MKNFNVISDPGIDDIVALTLLYKINSKVNHLLVSSFGNATANITEVNASEFIKFIAPNWFWRKGAELPLNGKFEHPWPDYFHGKDGVWGVHPPLPNKNFECKQSNIIYNNVISLAPMTEFHKVLTEEKISQATIMGGAFEVQGNETLYAETNVAFDPDAAGFIFDNCQSLEIKVVPLNVTRKVFWTKEAVSQIPEKNELNSWLKKLLLAWFKKYDHSREKNFNLHDPLAVYLTFFPNEAEWFTSGVKVIRKGEKRGQTIFDPKKPVCEVAMEVKDPQKIAKEIYKNIFL